jgi:hypothetical protein
VEYSFLKKQQSFCALPGGKEVVENEKILQILRKFSFSEILIKKI